MASKKPRVLLIDGDILVYRQAFIAEHAFDWGDGIWTLHSDADEAIASFDSSVNRMVTKLNADKAVVALSDNDCNFRKDLFPAYKENRTETRRPLAYEAVRAHAFANWDGRMKPCLEADDMLGILATNPKLLGDYQKIIVSADKDLLQVAGHHANATDLEESYVTPEQGANFHLLQTLTGDTTDNYPGAPGVGPVTALEAIGKGLAWTPQESGKWKRFPEEDPWKIVVSYFNKAGLTEEDALVQARVARILQHEDYDYKNQRPILWTP